MDRDWKTLVLVAIGATIVGWSMVRMLTRKTYRQGSPIASVAMSPTPTLTSSVIADPPSRVAMAQGTPGPGATSDDDKLIDILDRDLALLMRILVLDRQIEHQVMPRVNDVMNLPRVTEYRRERDFWESHEGGNEP